MKYQIADSSTLFVENPVAYPEKVFGKDELIVNDEGLNKFKCKLMGTEGDRLEHYDMIVWATSNPLEGIPAMTPVVCKNVEISFGTYRDNEGKQRKYWNLNAASIKKA